MEQIVQLAMDRIVEVVQAAQPYAELVSPLTFDYANAQVAELSITLGLATDQLRYVLCLFAAYPLAVVYKLLPAAPLKHVFDIVVGILLAQFVLGSGWVHSFISSAITYFLVKFGPAKYAPYIVFIFNMTYMSAAHIYRLYVDYMGWTLDFTGPQMLLVIKLTSFAYNYYDGVVDKTGDKKDLSAVRLLLLNLALCLLHVSLILLLCMFISCRPRRACTPAARSSLSRRSLRCSSSSATCTASRRS